MKIIKRRLEHGFRRSSDPDLVVVHCMAEYLDMDPDMHAVDFLDKMGWSAHAFVEPDGTIIRSREDHEGAYHAKGHNSHSLGVEILVEGFWTYGPWLDRIQDDWVTDKQYEVAVTLVKGWCSRYSIPVSQVVRHSDVDPERKRDPGEGFPWQRFQEDLQ